MQLIAVKDGGITRPKYFDIQIGVIHLVVSERDADPHTITGYCNPAHKSGIIAAMNKVIWEVDQ